MPTLCKLPDGKFFDADYFERGPESGKGWLRNYRWMPRRSFKEALALIDYMDIDEQSLVLDVGCAKGFIVKALRILGIDADGCDISEYALSFAPKGCWHCESIESWAGKSYSHAFVKDMLEHNTPEQLDLVLKLIASVSSRLLAVVPMGDNGIYRIKEYHQEITHLIAQDEAWWRGAFKAAGWSVIKETPHLSGIKDNWQQFAQGKGNRVFLLEHDGY